MGFRWNRQRGVAVEHQAQQRGARATGANHKGHGRHVYSVRCGHCGRWLWGARRACFAQASVQLLDALLGQRVGHWQQQTLAVHTIVIVQNDRVFMEQRRRWQAIGLVQRKVHGHWQFAKWHVAAQVDQRHRRLVGVQKWRAEEPWFLAELHNVVAPCWHDLREPCGGHNHHASIAIPDRRLLRARCLVHGLGHRQAKMRAEAGQ